MGKFSCEKYNRLYLLKCEQAIEYRMWTRIEGRLTDRERAEKEAAYRAYCAADYKVDRHVVRCKVCSAP